MAKYTKTAEWWSARRGTRPASRSVFEGYATFGSTLTEQMTMDRERTSPWRRIANNGELVYLSRGGDRSGTGFTVYAGTMYCPPQRSGTYVPCQFSQHGSVEAPAGAFRCDDAAFGTSGGRDSCYVLAADIGYEPPPGNAVWKADQDVGFRVDAPSVVYYGQKGAGPYVPRLVEPSSYICNNKEFGPDPAFGRTKECLLAPRVVAEEGAPMTYYDDLARQYEAMQRAEVAAQAQRDMVAAQDRVFADRQAADYAAQQAQIAQNAQAQEAAALAAAEMYREAQQAAQRQAAQYAAELAALAAANASDIDAAMAAAEMAAQAEALRQALAQAQAHEAEQRAAYDMANAATQAEMRNQEQANARLDAAENAADQAAANAAAGGASSPFANLSTTEMLMYGGIAAAAIYLLMGEKKAAQ
jgi:hypothetical protein